LQAARFKKLPGVASDKFYKKVIKAVPMKIGLFFALVGRLRLKFGIDNFIFIC